MASPLLPARFVQHVTSEYPRPIAEAMRRLNNAKDQDRSPRLVDLGEITLQTIAVFLLANHVGLKLPANHEAAVQEAIGTFRIGDSAGKWERLIKTLCDVLERLPEGTRQYFPEVPSWWKKEGQAAASAFAAWRNAANHRKIGGSIEIGHQRVTALLESSEWLCSVKLTQFLDSRKVKGGRKGTVVLHRGDSPLRVKGQWTADVSSDCLYLLRQSGELLALSPFVMSQDQVEVPKNWGPLNSDPDRHPLLFWRGLKERKGRGGSSGGKEELFELSAWLTGGEKTLPMPGAVWTSDPPMSPQASLSQWAERESEEQGFLDNDVCASLKDALSAKSQSPSPHLPSGWRELGVLGQGAHAEVLRVTKGGQERAVKILRRDLVGEKRQKAAGRLENEFHLFEHLSKLRNPGEGRLFVISGTRETTPNGESCLLMPVIRSSLERRLKGRLAVDEALRLSGHVARGVRFLHRNRILHRDLKPQNMLLDGQKLVIVDLSVARYEDYDGQTMVDEFVGTRGYAAPEVERGGLATEASDVFSLGRVLEEIWKTDDSLELPDRVERLIERMLQQEHSGRPTADQVVRALERASEPRFGAAIGDASQSPETRLALKLRRAVEQGELPTIADLQEQDLCPGLSREVAAAISRELHTLRRRHLSATWFHETHRTTFGDLRRLRRANISKRKSRLWLEARGLRVRDAKDLAAADVGLQQILQLQHPRKSAGGLTEKALRQILGRINTPEAKAEPSNQPAEEGADPWVGEWSTLASLFPENPYVRRRLRKKSGGYRTLHKPKDPLMALQQLLAPHLARRLLTLRGNHAAMAFLHGRSTALAARLHAGATAAVVADIHCFFGSIRPSHVPWDLLLDDSVPPMARGQLKNLLFVRDHHAPCLPQGAPTSPALSNLAALALDRLLLRVCGQLGWTYTRYADDLFISTVSPEKDFHEKALELIRKGLERYGWRLSECKTKLQRAGHGAGLLLCGLKVPPHADQPLSLPRSMKRQVRQALFTVSEHWEDLTEQDQLNTRGTLAYAYQATAQHRLAAATPGQARRKVERIGELCFGPQRCTAFLAAWSITP